MSRRRWRYLPNPETGVIEAVEIGDDVPCTPRVQLQTGAHYEGLQATDGTPIDSRQKHREYMKRNNLALADDFKETWANAPKQAAREESQRLDADFKRTVYELKLKQRRHR